MSNDESSKLKFRASARAFVPKPKPQQTQPAMTDFMAPMGMAPQMGGTIDFASISPVQLNSTMEQMQQLMAAMAAGAGPVASSSAAAATQAGKKPKSKGSARPSRSGSSAATRVPRVLITGVPRSAWRSVVEHARTVCAGAIRASLYSDEHAFGMLTLASPRAIGPAVGMHQAVVAGLQLSVVKCDIVPTVPSLVIKRLPAKLDESALRKLLTAAIDTPPASSSLLRDPATGESKCTGFANYHSIPVAIAAYSRLQGVCVDGQALRVEFQRGPPEAQPAEVNEAPTPPPHTATGTGTAAHAQKRGDKAKAAGRRSRAPSESTADRKPYRVPMQLFDAAERDLYDQVVAYRQACDAPSAGPAPEMVFSSPLPPASATLLHSLCGKIGLTVRPLGAGYAVALAPAGTVPEPSTGRRSRASSNDFRNAAGTRSRASSNDFRNAAGTRSRASSNDFRRRSPPAMAAAAAPSLVPTGAEGVPAAIHFRPPTDSQERTRTRSRASSMNSTGGGTTRVAKGPDGSKGFRLQRSTVEWATA